MQSRNQTINQSTDQTTMQSINEACGQLSNPTIDQFTNKTTTQSINQAYGQLSNLTIDQSTAHSINRAYGQLSNPTIDQLLDQAMTIDKKFKKCIQSRTTATIGDNNSATALKNVSGEILSLGEIMVVEKCLDSMLFPVASKYVRATDNNGESLLFVCNSVFLLEILTKYQCDVNLKNIYGQTPLMYACLTQNVEKIIFLLKSGANVNDRDDQNKTPLMYLCNRVDETNNESTIQAILGAIELLIEKGADCSMKCKDDKKPLDYVANKGLLSRSIAESLGMNIGFFQICSNDPKIETNASIIAAESVQKRLIQRVLYHLHINQNFYQSIKRTIIDCQDHDEHDIQLDFDDLTSELSRLNAEASTLHTNITTIRQTRPDLISEVCTLLEQMIHFTTIMKTVQQLQINIHAAIELLG